MTTSARMHFVGDYLPCDAAPSLPRAEPYVGNLECALTADVHRGTKAYAVTKSLEAIKLIAASGFSALSLANNHTGDSGAIAFDEMLRRLRAETPQSYFGTADAPYATIEVQGKRVAVIGCLESCRSRLRVLFPQEDVARLIRTIRDEHHFVIVTPHWGKEGEYAAHPSPAQRRLARAWIDAGADAVIGHHSHTVQGREMLDGRPVYYSVGNFFFPHEEGGRHPLTMLGLMVDVCIGPDSACWGHSFLRTVEDAVRPLQLDDGKLLNQYLESLSADLPTWNLWRWCRAVGPIYHSKSSRSWERRRTKYGLRRVLPKQIAWNFLPSVLLLRLGSFLPDNNAAHRTSELEQRLLNMETAHAFRDPPQSLLHQS